MRNIFSFQNFPLTIIILLVIFSWAIFISVLLAH